MQSPRRSSFLIDDILRSNYGGDSISPSSSAASRQLLPQPSRFSSDRRRNVFDDIVAHESGASRDDGDGGESPPLDVASADGRRDPSDGLDSAATPSETDDGCGSVGRDDNRGGPVGRQVSTPTGFSIDSGKPRRVQPFRPALSNAAVPRSATRQDVPQPDDPSAGHLRHRLRLAQLSLLSMAAKMAAVRSYCHPYITNDSLQTAPGLIMRPDCVDGRHQGALQLPMLSSADVATAERTMSGFGDYLNRVKCRRNRTVFTDHHLTSLEKSFERQKYLSTRDRAQLAAQLGLSQIQVKTWYQNRRMKWKKQVMQQGGAEPPTKPKGRPRKIEDDDVRIVTAAV